MINKIQYKITDKIDFKNPFQTVFYVNIYSYLIIRKHPFLTENVNYYTLDGIMLVLFVRFFSKIKVKRKSPDFSSYFKDFFDFLEANNKKIYLVGGSEIEIRDFVKIINKRYSNIIITGHHNGYGITQKKENEIVDFIKREKVDTLIVGMGTPKQEYFLIKAKNNGFLGSCFSCGAFISQTASKGEKYYPIIIDKFHLRWLYRIYNHPQLIKRYLIYYPKGLLFLLKDKFLPQV